jgi:RNA polymerase sigma-70 factor, ECF subfamily
VPEAYLRLVSQNLPDWESRAHFFGLAAHLMRRILVDHARRRRSSKLGIEAEEISLEKTVSFAPSRGRDMEKLDGEQKLKTLSLR